MPAVPNIVRINEIDQCVAKALDGIRLGVLAARKSGLQVEMPDEVAFDMIVVKDWQVLEATSKENGLSNETQGGGTTETSTETEIRTGKETGLRTESSETTDTDTKTGTETSKTSGRNTHNETSTKKTDS